MEFFILGGDSRNIELTKLLAKDENIVYTYGLEKAFNEKEEDEIFKNIIFCEDLKSIQKAKIIVTSLPISKDGINLNMPYSNKNITIKDLLSILKGKIIFTGNISTEIENILKKENEIIDIMKKEEFAILNAIPTAEATISIMIENTKKIIHNSKCLIMGFGRIGKVLANKLKALSVNVTCTTINKEEAAWAETYGYQVINFKDIENVLGHYDIIINTIPKLVLNDEVKKIRNEALIIDLASNPGGINKEIAKRENKKLICALGLPGKVAPITSAEYIRNVVFNVLNK